MSLLHLHPPANMAAIWREGERGRCLRCPAVNLQVSSARWSVFIRPPLRVKKVFRAQEKPMREFSCFKVVQVFVEVRTTEDVQGASSSLRNHTSPHLLSEHLSHSCCSVAPPQTCQFVGSSGFCIEASTPSLTLPHRLAALVLEEPRGSCSISFRSHAELVL